MLIPLLLVLITLIVMEFAVATFHQHFMHGIGWEWHESHHVSHKVVRLNYPSQHTSGKANTNFNNEIVEKAGVEKNDLYAVIFAGVTLLLFVFTTQFSSLWWIGVGISLYGFLYALMHDVIVHRRLNLRWKPRNAYLVRLVKAHHLHHAMRVKEHGISFGFLYAPPLHTLHAQLRTNVKNKIVNNTILHQNVHVETSFSSKNNCMQIDVCATKKQST